MLSNFVWDAIASVDFAGQATEMGLHYRLKRIDIDAMQRF